MLCCKKNACRKNGEKIMHMYDINLVVFHHPKDLPVFSKRKKYRKNKGNGIAGRTSL